MEEQRFVEQHVEDVFKSIGLLVKKEGPATYQTGSGIEHLRTVYHTDKSKISTSELLNKLHPTPAVCGLPVALSGKWLEKHEGYNRTFYSGYLGPVNMNGASNLYVNLRCARVHGSNAIIFVGGGITESSDPQLEWTETELKSRTLLNIIESKLKI
jgi:isochorismate synthase